VKVKLGRIYFSWGDIRAINTDSQILIGRLCGKKMNIAFPFVGIMTTHEHKSIA
jgi:hypothetical protein